VARLVLEIALVALFLLLWSCLPPEWEDGSQRVEASENALGCHYL